MTSMYCAPFITCQVPSPVPTHGPTFAPTQRPTLLPSHSPQPTVTPFPTPLPTPVPSPVPTSVATKYANEVGSRRCAGVFYDPDSVEVSLVRWIRPHPVPTPRPSPLPSSPFPTLPPSPAPSEVPDYALATSASLIKGATLTFVALQLALCVALVALVTKRKYAGTHTLPHFFVEKHTGILYLKGMARLCVCVFLTSLCLRCAHRYEKRVARQVVKLTARSEANRLGHQVMVDLFGVRLDWARSLAYSKYRETLRSNIQRYGMAGNRLLEPLFFLAPARASRRVRR